MSVIVKMLKGSFYVKNNLRVKLTVLDSLKERLCALRNSVCSKVKI